MQLDGPKFVPKAVLTAGRLAHQPFEVPTEMTKSALLQGGVVHSAVGAINKTAIDALKELKPRGFVGTMLEKLSGKVDGALVHSAGQAKKATEVFWVPFSNGSHQIGDAVSNPFALFYAKRAGFEIPEDPAALQQLLALDIVHAGDKDTTKLHGLTFPTPPPPAEEPPKEEPKPDPKPGEGEGGDTKTGEGGDTKTGEGGDTKTGEGEGGETKTGESKTGEGGDTGGAGGGEGEGGGDTKTGEGGDAGGTGGGEGGDTVTTTTTTTDGDAAVVVDEAAVDASAVDPAAVDPAAVDPAASGGGEAESVTPPEGARSIAPPEVSAQAHPAGIDPAVMAAAAAASVASQSTDTAPVQDATSGTDAITVPVQDDAAVQPPVVTDTPVTDAPVQPPVVTDKPVADTPVVKDAPAVNPGA